MADRVIYATYDDDHTLMEGAKKLVADGVHITEATSESGVHITGVNADAMFSMCRNALACNREYSVFHELSNKPHQLASAKEMVKALNEYIQSQESTEERN